MRVRAAAGRPLVHSFIPAIPGIQNTLKWRKAGRQFAAEQRVGLPDNMLDTAIRSVSGLWKKPRLADIKARARKLRTVASQPKKSGAGFKSGPI